MTELLNDRIIEWQNDWMIEWLNDKMIELQNDWIRKGKRHGQISNYEFPISNVEYPISKYYNELRTNN